ncbi:MAG: 4-(cytidine 5'-diphospho)-2-C-methyl-D-erythritol kinase [Magnetococcales bacterium]|nr:4-(cytidine 5'-diphospho)-2-C-methyl-D-erythritol kinase [Magnetococcales bacterium]
MTVHLFSAPAKINLSLRIVGRRDDGFHLLQTVMSTVSLFDGLAVTPNREGRLSLEVLPELDIAAKDNLVMKGMVALREQAGDSTLGASVRLYKRIPSQAGLGGGSSDVATILLALNRLWKLNLPLKELIPLGVRLGADVPIFLGGTAAWAEGVGERLTPLRNPPSLPLVLINPGTSLSTPHVFRTYAGQLTNFSPRTSMPLSDGDEAWSELETMQNDLQDAAIELDPEINATLQALTAAGARVVRMSGSGSTVFGLFSSDRQAWQAAESVRKHHPQWRVYPARTLPLHPFLQEEREQLSPPPAASSAVRGSE